MVVQRRTSAERRAALVEWVRSGIRSGRLSAGVPLPSLRELGTEFGLSRSTVQIELGPLIAQGLLRAAPRSGIFVAGPELTDAGGCFVMVCRDSPAGSAEWLHAEALRRGFERAISQRGGFTMFLRSSDLESPDVREQIPLADGVFVFVADLKEHAWSPPAGAAQVYFDYEVNASPGLTVDRVHFDDLDGGRLATQHLIRLGYERIAFMAIHTVPPATAHQWSQERESGWRSAMRQALPGTDLVSFHPTTADMELSRDGRVFAGRVAERMLAHRGSFDAVVASDDVCIAGLVAALKHNGVPAAQWPAMVGFEGFPEMANFVVTSVVPPWERLGESAGELVWQRANGQVEGPAVERVVAMEIASRLSTRKDWNDTGAAAALLR